MAIDSKISFLNQLEKRLSAEIPADALSKVIIAVSDVMENYQMVMIPSFDQEKDDCLNAFLTARTIECRSQKTLDRYRYIIGRLMDFVKLPTRRITVHHIRAYLSAEKARGIADSTLEGYRQIFSGYFNWLQRESLIDRNPTANLGTIKCAKKEKKIYSAIDFEKMNRCCNSTRDLAIINFLSSTGCRVSEMTGLNRDDVNLQSLECAVHGKGNKVRTVYLSDVAGMLLREYLADRKDDHSALFYSKKGNRLAPGSVRYALKQIAMRSNVEHVHPHKFRRTLATNLARHGMPIQEVANILGHENIDTTMQYVVLNKEDTKSSYRRYA